MTIERLFFELLRVTVGNRSQLSASPSTEEWISLRQMADKQSLTGIVLHGIERLPKEQRPPQNLLLDWIGHSMVIRQRNNQTTAVGKKLVDIFCQAGYTPCILKGQANHAYYGEEIGNLRVCGDIDIWVVSHQGNNEKENVSRVLNYVYKTLPVESLCWLHVELKPIDTVPVEIHLRPSFFNSPLRNRRFQKYLDFEKAVCQKTIDGISLPALKKEYDIIFQLNHMFRHLLDEGIGLRQVVDYYFLLTSDEQYQKKDIQKIIKALGMWKFARALMYVMDEVLGLTHDKMLCEPSEKDGRFLLSEIMEAGNFGHYDARMASLDVKKEHFSYQIRHTWRRIKRNVRFLSSYPEEVIWEPVARCRHWVWKLRNN